MPGLLDDDRRENENRECNHSGEREIHDRNGEPAWDPDPSEPSHERIEQQGDEQRHEEEEDRVTHRSRHHPCEQKHERQTHELDPTWDLDARRRGGARHHVDGIAGNLALDIWLSPVEDSDTLADDMPSSRPTRRRRVERREVRAARRARRFALLTLLAIVLLIALLLVAFGGSSRTPNSLTIDPAVASAQTRPFPQILALHGAVRLQMPIAQGRRTAIGYHAASDGAIALTPLGHQGNEGVLQRVFHKIFGGGGGQPTWYRLSGGPTSALDVGAAPGTDVYSPVDGTVVGITPFVVSGHRYGSQIEIQPQTAPSLVVALTQLRVDPSLTVGSTVVSGATQLGVVVDLSAVEKQALARYTNDAGNHVSIELRPAASLVLN
jgi:hypothetical protein